MSNLFTILIITIILHQVVIGILAFRLGIRPNWMCFLPIFVNYAIVKKHCEMTGSFQSMNVKLFTAVIFQTFYLPALAADIRALQGGTRWRNYFAFFMPLPFAILAD